MALARACVAGYQFALLPATERGTLFARRPPRLKLGTVTIVEKDLGLLDASEKLLEYSTAGASLQRRNLTVQGLQGYRAFL